MKILVESYKIYGAPKITKVLQTKGHRIDQQIVSKYMNEGVIKAHNIMPYTTTTRNIDFSIELKNILNRDFTPDKPDAAWCSDITYIWTQTRFVYLTSITDLYSQKIIALELLYAHHVDGILSCIKKVKINRRLSNPVIIHSDCGSQYVSKDYKYTLGVNFIRSYPCKGNPWDNACIESFHALIKCE